jgi:hypothetical protein
MPTQHEAHRALVEAAREPGERVRRRGQYQAGIVLERTADSVLVWWGTSDRKKVTTWEKSGNVVAWTGREKAPSTTAPLKTRGPEPEPELATDLPPSTPAEIDLRDVPVAPARKVRSQSAAQSARDLHRALTAPPPKAKKAVAKANPVTKANPVKKPRTNGKA